MGILRDRMIEEMKLRNFSPATQESYLYAVTRLTKHYRRSPDQLDREQIRSYLLHLTVERKLSPNTMMGQNSRTNSKTSPLAIRRCIPVLLRGTHSSGKFQDRCRIDCSIEIL